MSSPWGLREDAVAIWRAAVAAVRPEDLMLGVVTDSSLSLEIRRARQILVVGAGKAGGAMAEALEKSLGQSLWHTTGIVNVPADRVRPLQAIRLHPARPPGANEPTAEGVEGARQILRLVSEAGPEDLGICLLSGGGSALLPAPVDGVSLEDKQQVTRVLHECGATIAEMNAVRKHLSKIKGGRLAEAFTGRALYSLIISDVIGDPLDVIASGPTAPDPTTFGDALAVLTKYKILQHVPPAVRDYLERGSLGRVHETPKKLRDNVVNRIIGNNALALAAARTKAQALGYDVVDLGVLQGDTQEVAARLTHVVQSIRAAGAARPVCVLSGGETTVTLGPSHGRGGRNQELVLALLIQLGPAGMKGTAVLSGGTDGEDGPTDAAGALADEDVWPAVASRGFDPTSFLTRHDAYPFFEATGGLFKTGLTDTNVMDVRVILVG
jgi:hydroxypyruvate reductase/glycerate 2-kinase